MFHVIMIHLYVQMWFCWVRAEFGLWVLHLIFLSIRGNLLSCSYLLITITSSNSSSSKKVELKWLRKKHSRRNKLDWYENFYKNQLGEKDKRNFCKHLYLSFLPLLPLKKTFVLKFLKFNLREVDKLNKVNQSSYITIEKVTREERGMSVSRRFILSIDARFRVFYSMYYPCWRYAKKAEDAS